MGLDVSAKARLSFADRKAWARRQGNPLWLWPEVAPRDWRAAMVEIECACAAILSGKRPRPLAGDAAAVALAGYTSGMGPLLGWWIAQEVLTAPRDLDRTFRGQLSANGARMEKLLETAGQVSRKLARGGIRATLLKGAHTAIDFFPIPACRPMSDIDMLVAPADAAEAGAVLEASGYDRVTASALEATWRHESAAREPLTALSLEADDPWTVDLHLSLDVPGPPGALPARLSQLASCVAESASLPPARTLRQPALLLHLAAHAGSGFHNLTLLRLVEIVLVARADRSAGALDWHEFVDAGRETRSLAFAYPPLALARLLSPPDIPHSVVAQCEAQAPPAVRQIVASLWPATAHRIDRPSIREHFAWTSGSSGWLRRLAADLVPEPRSFRKSAAIQAARARGLLRSLSA